MSRAVETPMYGELAPVTCEVFQLTTSMAGSEAVSKKRAVNFRSVLMGEVMTGLWGESDGLKKVAQTNA